MRCRQPTAGFTLVEVLMVVLLMSVLAAIALPSMNPSTHDQLQAVAEVVANDMAYARSLAVANNGTYRFTFDLTNNQYYLQYTGSNSALATLPGNGYYTAADSATQHYTALNNLPLLGGSVQLAGVGTTGSSGVPLTQVEFGPYGQTTQTAETDIWLTAGVGAVQRYIMVRINPVTGLAGIVNYQSSPPPASIVTGS